MKFGANAEAIINCGRDITGLAGQAREIKAAAEKATVPEQSWGLLGQALTYSDYVELQRNFMEHMDKMIENMEKVGGKLSLTGTQYRDTDQAVQGALDAIGAQLNAASAPPKVGG